MDFQVGQKVTVTNLKTHDTLPGVIKKVNRKSLRILFNLEPLFEDGKTIEKRVKPNRVKNIWWATK